MLGEMGGDDRRSAWDARDILLARVLRDVRYFWQRRSYGDPLDHSTPPPTTPPRHHLLEQQQQHEGWWRCGDVWRREAAGWCVRAALFWSFWSCGLFWFFWFFWSFGWLWCGGWAGGGGGGGGGGWCVVVLGEWTCRAVWCGVVWCVLLVECVLVAWQGCAAIQYSVGTEGTYS